ncbi:unnamed protein product [Heligmosomoides polygyrus]|uniref:Uncharacterized protein n=1 Tax=Heligmosomoides polygyrus TaxID=6339 RepID=A0A183FPY3_HELPZ|nr:unnamed protein product [Heligmosomoides polygyrus]
MRIEIEILNTLRTPAFLQLSLSSSLSSSTTSVHSMASKNGIQPLVGDPPRSPSASDGSDELTTSVEMAVATESPRFGHV